MKDNWNLRNKMMACKTCMWFVEKTRVLESGSCENGSGDIRGELGRCRRHAPTLNGFPAVFYSDFCGDHKLDENRI